MVLSEAVSLLSPFFDEVTTVSAYFGEISWKGYLRLLLSFIIANGLHKITCRCSGSSLYRWNYFSYPWGCRNGARFAYQSCPNCCFSFSYPSLFNERSSNQSI
ncbi:hypothetical protein AAZV13_09G081850 [Glycine max]|uniref:uncharacterized protein LOC114366942 n=1 Tax=Glycine soja TaxID=3848 RepID=UPI0003DE9C33|nr:uncharacterized protein LOC114366942 [Glycine soja]XP_040860855.1 uncharacterized protein LOC100806228 [Glycine max]|eukprot:XP_014617532.1 uncharacterized protein LOC100806228 [Glycine max]